jgi:hypothetical protein
MRLAEHDYVIEAFATFDPMSRSTWPFCHGERGAVGWSRIPIARMRRV